VIAVFSRSICSFCLALVAMLPDGDTPLTLFLKTDNHEDYIVFIKTDLDELFSKTDSDIDTLALCTGMK
jgi:hypothetical protein